MVTSTATTGGTSDEAKILSGADEPRSPKIGSEPPRPSDVLMSENNHTGVPPIFERPRWSISFMSLLFIGFSNLTPLLNKLLPAHPNASHQR